MKRKLILMCFVMFIISYCNVFAYDKQWADVDVKKKEVNKSYIEFEIKSNEDNVIYTSPHFRMYKKNKKNGMKCRF